jgi:Gas vesicle protein
VAKARDVGAPAADRILDSKESTLLDLLDRLLDKGVVATGDVMLGVAGVDLIYVRLSAIVCAADQVLPSDSSPPGRHRRRTNRGR